jgi:hypothetical protein
MINTTVNEVDYDSLAEDESEPVHQNVVELKFGSMRPGLQKNKDHLLKQRDANRMSSSQELLNKARSWQGPALSSQPWKQIKPNFNTRSTLLIPDINRVF